MNIFSYVKTKIQILDVVSDYTTVKKAGNYWKGRCPFHNEKTASFTVSPHKEIFYCFGCHIGGDVITFISKVEGCSQIEAAKHLATKYQIDLPESLTTDTAAHTQEKDKYFDLCETFSNWCHNQLLASPHVIRYLQERGFNQQSINMFNLGYFPGGLRSIKTLTGHMSKHSFIQQDLLEAKILAEGKKVIYSPFEERILFPIKDLIGRYCGFGGRIFKDGDQRAKYYNSHENTFFNKGSLLFGFDLARKSLLKKDHMFLVEGYTDCIAMSQHGFTNTVATLGTSCTQEHLKILSRYIQSLYVLYDGDNAGKNAILRLTELCWQVNLELKVTILPDKEDPASFLGKGGNIESLMRQSKDIFVFLIDTIGQSFMSKTLSKKLKLANDIIKTINNIQDPIKRDILLQKASKAMQIPINSIKTENQPSKAPTKNSLQSQSVDHKLEKKIFFAIMNNMKLLNEDNGEFLVEYLPHPIKEIFAKLKIVREKQKTVDFTPFFDRLDDNERQYVSKVLLEFEGSIKKGTFEKLLLQLQKKNWKSIVQNIKLKLEQAKREADESKVENILLKFNQLKKKLLQTNLVEK